MSVIGNALKAAQKEKQRKAGGGSGALPPVLVPLRSKGSAGDSAGFSWKRALTLGIGGAAMFAVTVMAVKVMKGRTQAGPAPAPIILGDAPPVVVDSVPVATDSARAVVIPSSKSVAKAPAARRPGAAERTPVRAPARVAQTAAAAPVPPPRRDSSANLRIAVEMSREDAARLFAAAVAAHRQGDLAYARTAYERVLVMAPGDVDAMNNLAVLLLARRELDAAERLLRRAVSLAPRNVGVWSNLGTVLRERGQSGDAIAAFQQALSIDPQHVATRVSLAQQFYAIASYAKAREILERVVAENPGVAEAQYALGQVLEQQGDIPGAVRAYSTFVRVAPPRLAAHVEVVRRRITELSGRS